MNIGSFNKHEKVPIVHQRFVLFPPGTAWHKRRALGVCLLLAPCWAGAQTPGRLIVPRAAHVDIAHTGTHTHANFIFFDTGTRDLAAMQADPIHFSHLTIRAHSRLSTDHAALPPDLAMPGDPPLDNPYGPMEGGHGKPGWGVIPLHQAGHKGAMTNGAKVVVPTRFANWVALQPPTRRKSYLDPRRYWLEVHWDK